MKKSFVLVGLAAAVSLSACNCDTRSAGYKIDEPVVATVNGQDIGISWYEILVGRAQRIGITEPEKIVEELTAIEALRQEAIAQGLDKDPEVIARLQHQQANVMADTILKKYMDNLEITDADLQTKYQELIKNFKAENEFNARHILLDEKDEDKAKNLIKELEGGADFEALAKEHSTGPTGPKGGSLGWFSSNHMVKPFSEAVAAMTKGEVSKAPVKTQFGWHIIKLEDTRESKAPTLESMKPQLKEAVLGEKLEVYIDGIREKAEIKIDLEALKDPKEAKKDVTPSTETATPEAEKTKE